MNEIDNTKPCALNDSDLSNRKSVLNTTMNVIGVMFITSFLGYLAMHLM